MFRLVTKQISPLRVTLYRNAIILHQQSLQRLHTQTWPSPKVSRVRETKLIVKPPKSFIAHQRIGVFQCQMCTITPSEEKGEIPTWKEFIEPLKNKKRNRGWLYFTLIGALVFTGATYYFKNNAPAMQPILEIAENTEDLVTKYQALMNITMLCQVGAMMDPQGFAKSKNMETLLKAISSSDEVIQMEIMKAMVGFSENREILLSLPQRLPLNEIADDINEGKKHVDLVEQYVNLCERLALLNDNAVSLATLPALRGLLFQAILVPEEPKIQSHAIHTLTLLSRNAEAREYLPHFFGSIHEAWGTVGHPIVEKFCRETMANLLNHSTAPDSDFSTALNEELDRLKLSEEELKKLKVFHRENPVKYYPLEALFASGVIGAFYGAARWAVFSRGKGLSSGQIANVLRFRIPVTALASMLMWSQMHLDTELITKLLSKDTPVNRVLHPLSIGVYTIFIWAMLGATPYCLLPSFAYPGLWTLTHMDDQWSDWKWDDLNGPGFLGVNRLMFGTSPSPSPPPKE